MGSILLRNQDGKIDWPIGYSVRKLGNLEHKLVATNKECPTVALAVLMLRPYLAGSWFTVWTDHEAVKWLMTISEASNYLAYKTLSFPKCNLYVVHRAVVKQQTANALLWNKAKKTDETSLHDSVPFLLLTRCIFVQERNPLEKNERKRNFE